MKGTMRIDLFRGCDSDDEVRQVLLRGIENDKVQARPVGSMDAYSQPWEFTGDVRDLFTVLLNYSGLMPTQRDLLNMLVHNNQARV